MSVPFPERVRELVLTALDLEPEAREEWLADACRNDQPLMDAVRARIRNEDEPTIQGAHAGSSHSASMPTLPARARVDSGPRHVGYWRLSRMLGEGGMGTVWLADRVDGEIQMQAAVKLVRARVAHNELLARFRRERQIMADLKHPYIGTLYDAGTTEDGQPYLVMEFVDGQILTEFCRHYLSELPETIQLFRKVCEAVAYAHRKGVIHRDIKPGNIMVSAEGVPKLLDFGIAFFDGASSEITNPSRPSQVAMTPEYASPELMVGGEAGVQSDIYALGLVLAELATGKRPRDLGNDKPAAVDRHLSAHPQMCELLKTALAHERRQRFASVSELMDALDQYSGSNAPRTTTVVCHYDVIRQAVLTPDNRHLVTLARDRTMHLWNLDGVRIPDDLTLRRELFKRGLYHFGYRMDGIKLEPVRRHYLQGVNGYRFPEARPYDHLDKPRPPNTNLLDWLMENH